MNTNSNSYTILYASVMVIVVAFLLAFVSSSLKDIQNANVELDGKKQILAALNLRNSSDVAADYTKFVKQDQLMQADGTLVAYEGVFQSSYKEEMDANRFHVFVCEVEGATKYVLPVCGAGLWGPIWGYVALNEDKTTVYGAYFSHKGETPGLGADIATEKFQDQFINKEVFNGDEIALTVVKNGKVVHDHYEVDGISGGTITSVGVAHMLRDCLGVYAKFLTNK
ncbi:MAG: Na(+)-translocating NADH-quinone reductase subunit C [Phocaeicola sp.]